MAIVHLMDLAAKLLLFWWFVYAMQTHFLKGKNEPVGMKLIKLCSLTALGINLWLFFSVGEERASYGLLGLGVTIVSAFTFHRAVRASKAAGLHVAFSESTAASLVSNGIFGLVRHPFYLAYTLYWFAWCVSLGFSIPSVSVFAVLFALYILSVRVEERELKRNFGHEYEEYRKRTSLLIPYLM